MKEFSRLRTLLLIGIAAVSIALPASAAQMLTVKNGMTLYVFDKYVAGGPTYYDACAKQLPPYLAEDVEKRGPRCSEWVTRKRWDHGTEQRSGELRIWRTFVGRQRGAEEREVSSRFA